MKTNEIVLTTVKLPADFVDTTMDYEEYALVYSKVFHNIQENVDCDDLFNGYVKLTSKSTGCSVYRKCRAYKGCKSGDIAIGSRTRKELGDGKDEVIIQHTNWLAYNLHHSDRSRRASVIITLIALLCSILSSIISVLSLFVPLPLCH